MAAFIPKKVNAKRIKSFKALFFGGHHFWHIQRKCRKNTKENLSSDHNCYNFLQEGPINSISLPDCCIFIAVSEKYPFWPFLMPYGQMVKWPYGHFLTKWPFAHIVKTWSYGINMGISGNSYKNAAFWWRNWVDSTFLQEMKAIIVRWQIFLCIFLEFPLYMQKMVATEK